MNSKSNGKKRRPRKTTKGKMSAATRNGGDEKYKAVLERISDAFIALDKNFCYTYVNRRTGELIGKDPEWLIGKNVWEVFPDAVGSLTYKAFMTAMKEQRFIVNIDYYEPLDLWQENHIYPSPEGLSIFIKDISERKRLEREMLHKEKIHQRQMISIALEAQEKERTYIGKELHDNVNQVIVGTRLLLNHLKEQPEKMDEVLQICIHNLDRAIKENRKLAHELVAPDLENENLVEQINNLVKPMMDANGIHSRIDTAKLNEKLLDKQKKLNVYRIVQEQCTNIVKYAKAKKAVFKLRTFDNIFKMTIEDDGRGASNLKLHKGIGLKNIEGRVSIFNGHMEIRSARGKGFKLEISLPLIEQVAV